MITALLAVVLLCLGAYAVLDRGLVERLGSSPTTPLPTVPAIGPAQQMSSFERRARVSLLVFALAVVAAAFVLRGTLGSAPGEQVPPIRNAAYVVPGALIRGTAPRDADLRDLRDLYNVGGIVSLKAASEIEASVVRGFRLDGLQLPVPSGKAPTARQLRTLAEFLGSQRARRRSVYLYDDSGLDTAPTAGIMAAMLHGVPTADAIEAARREQPARRLFTPGQLRSIQGLGRALQPSAGPPQRTAAGRGSEYRRVAGVRW